jgi:hypothetical protein
MGSCKYPVCPLTNFQNLYIFSCLCRPRTKEELFNLRHAQLRNVIERIFGVIKRRWGIIREVCEYPLRVQSQLPLALAALHNFIIIYDPPKKPFRLPEVRELQDPDPNGDSVPTVGISSAETTRASRLRDSIATAMWESYLAETARRAGVGHTQSLPNM